MAIYGRHSRRNLRHSARSSISRVVEVDRGRSRSTEVGELGELGELGGVCARLGEGWRKEWKPHGTFHERVERSSPSMRVGGRATADLSAPD